MAVEWLEHGRSGTMVHCEIEAGTTKTKTELEVFRAFSALDRPGVQRSKVHVGPLHASSTAGTSSPALRQSGSQRGSRVSAKSRSTSPV